jgi:hypothetical protein
LPCIHVPLGAPMYTAHDLQVVCLYHAFPLVSSFVWRGHLSCLMYSVAAILMLRHCVLYNPALWVLLWLRFSLWQGALYNFAPGCLCVAALFVHTCGSFALQCAVLHAAPAF